MSRRQGPLARFGQFFATVFFLIAALPLLAAPYAAMVMDARTGEVLHSRNADTRLHPASLTKMMTLYIAFEAVEHGEITLDTMVTITPAAANEPPSKLGLRSGQQIRFRHLIRAAAIKSANDAATAIAIALEGSEEAFARRMTRTAQAMGMTRTTFRNAHGLTQNGHMSTARDMTFLGRHVIYDYPEYYHLFSRRSVDAGMATVNNTNRRLLNAYRGADGIKTGYTRAAGYNLVASAERGQERVIATMFGGRSSAHRNARVAELLDMGFDRAPSRAALQRPRRPSYGGGSDSPAAVGRTIRVSGAVTHSLRPRVRTTSQPEPEIVISEADILDALSEATQTAAVQAEDDAGLGPTHSISPQARPERVQQVALEQPSSAQPQPEAEIVQEVITRISSSGGRHWGINVGRYTTHHAAERILLQTALTEMSSLDGSLRRVVRRSGGYDANFLGLTREGAELACRRLLARGVDCTPIGPS